jgi:hypothetical protein
MPSIATLKKLLTGTPGFLPGPISVSAGAGTPAGTGVTATEYGDGIFHKTVLTFASLVITMTDATTAGSHGTQKIYDFPAGQIGILGVVTDLHIVAATGIGATAAVVGAIGTAAVGTDNATLLTTEADIVPSTAATLTDSAGDFNAIMGNSVAALTDSSGGTSGGDTIAAIVAATDVTAAGLATTKNAIATLAAKVNALIALLTGAFKAFDGTGTAKDAVLNFAVPDAGSTANSTLTVTGTVTIHWINLGDN